MQRLLLIFLFLFSLKPCKAQYFDTLHIYYDIGVSGLQKKDMLLLDSIVANAKLKKMLVYSYADYLGSERTNQHLSENRAKEIKNYLLQKGIPPMQIMECAGLGRIAGSGGARGDITYRRSDIFIRRETNRVESMQEKGLSKEMPLPGKINQGILVKEDNDEATAQVTQIDLRNLNVNETVKLENIQYYPGRADILIASYPELDNLYKVMYDNPKLRIRLEGHVCCCVYPDGFFKDTPTWGLSIERAQVVYEHLIKRGISADRMQYEGFGRTKPICDNERTIEEGQVNRRVEIRILEK